MPATPHYKTSSHESARRRSQDELYNERAVQEATARRAQYLKEGNTFTSCEFVHKTEIGQLKVGVLNRGGRTCEIVHNVLRIYVHILLDRGSTF